MKLHFNKTETDCVPYEVLCIRNNADCHGFFYLVTQYGDMLKDYKLHSLKEAEEIYNNVNKDIDAQTKVMSRYLKAKKKPKVYTVPIQRVIESSIQVKALNPNDAKIKAQGLLDDGYDIDDEDQYWNDWEVC